MDWVEDCLGCTPVMRERDLVERLGVSRRRAQDLVAEGVVVRLRRGIVVGQCTVERMSVDHGLAHSVAIHTMLLTHDEVVASHQSAGLLHGLPLLNTFRYAVGTRAAGGWRNSRLSRIRMAPLPAHHITEVTSLRCTTVPRTVVDVARRGSFREAVVLGDAALRDRCTTPDLTCALDEMAAWAEVKSARKVAGFLDARSESALESVSRAIFHERALPPPELQVAVDHDGRTSYRLDFLWRARGVVGEADGLGKYDDIAVLRAEKVRQERLERMGFTVVRWNWREMLVYTDETISRIRAALRS